jgi:NADH-quinone oxidoreductase subunit H
MGFAWKCLFPLALINLLVVGAEVVGFDGDIPWWILFVNFAVAGVFILLWSRFFTLGGGRVEVKV